MPWITKDGRRIFVGEPNQVPNRPSVQQAGISDGVKRAIKNYTAKRGPLAPKFPASPSDYKELSQHINSGRFEGNVHRGMGFSDKEWSKHFGAGWTNPGTEIPLSGKEADLVSFTRAIDRIGGYSSGAQPVFLHAEGGGTGRDISEHSIYPEEKEVLVPGSSKFIVHHAEVGAGGIWHMGT